MRVVVVGASGNVGSALLRRLETEDAVTEVVAIARRPPAERTGKATWHRSDVAADDLAFLFRGADAVVHLAWLFQPTHRPSTTWQANVVGTSRVLDAVEQAGVPAVVVASSVGAYSPRAGLTPVDETWPTDGCPTAAYSREKAYVERLLDVHAAAHAERRVVRMRPAFIFQRSSAVQQRRLFAGPFVPHALLRRGRLPVLPLPRDLRLQTLHSDDVAEAYTQAVLRDVRGPFNLTTEGSLGPADLAAVLGARHVPVPARVVRAGLVPAYAAHLVPASPGLFDLAMSVPMMQADRARAELGWTPRHDARSALEAFFEGIETGAEGATAPLAAGTSGPLRSHELGTGVGETP